MVKTNFWKNRKILITGGSGMLGSELTRQLLGLGADVTLIVRDRLSKSRLYVDRIDKNVSFVYGDITDFELVERAVGEYVIDTIFHLAAQTIVGIGNNSPLSTFNSNIKGTWNVLEAARLHKNHIRSVVVASSDKAYGTSDKLPYDETTELKGLHPYDVSKTCTDILAQTYWNSYKLPVSITRCGNLFGPGDLNFNRIVPGTIHSVLNNERPMIRSDGKFIRNYFFIKDAASAYIKISENMDKAKGEAFNIGSEERYSVLEITDMILRTMNSKLKPIIKNEASNEIYEQYLDIKKIKKILNWSPKYSTKRALKETVAWYEKNFR